MSFLAQLRQNRPNTTQGPKLCYLLQIQEKSKTVKLQLTLAELQQGGLREQGEPYKIQRQHLQHLPPFISEVDINPLQILIETKPNGLPHEAGDLPVEKWLELIPLLLKTQRCFIETPQGSRQKLAPAPPVPVKLVWLPSHTGTFQLSWQADATGKLLYLDAKASYPLLYDAATGLLSLTQHQLNSAAVDTLAQVERYLPASKVAGFLAEHEARWAKVGLPLPKAIPQQQLTAEIHPVLRLASRPHPKRAAGFEGSIELMFRYIGEHYCICIPYDAEQNRLEYWDGIHINHLTRDPQQERVFFRQLQPFIATLKPTDHGGKWLSSERSQWLQLLTESRQELAQQGFSFWIEPGFRHHYVVADQWRVEIDGSDNQALQLSVLLELGDDKFDLLNLLRQLQRFNRQQATNETTLTLPDGRLLLLPTPLVNGIMDELGDLLVNQGGPLRLPRSQIARLDDLRQQLPEATQWQGAVEHLNFAVSLHNIPTLLDQALSGVEAELRPYQWLGVCWLQHLKQHQVNGLLADDMGLGKTLQILAHLSLEQQQGCLQHPALIVLPTSLLHNWALEVERFTPHLRYKIVHGPKRGQSWDKLQDYDLLISSYQLIVNDLAHWQTQKLSWIVLDEAQQIKNPRTQVRQAIQQLESDYRICLTGTPVQNHLGELWSLLDFLMPGCLNNLADFKCHYQKPIEQEANEERMEQLQKRIAPFMLRRTKDQVARDLPQKTEIYQYISLADDQQEFYDTQRNTGSLELQAQLSDSGHDGQQQILLLTALLKLRQVCCDPKLLDAPDISSAKREHCMEMIKELVEERRTTLLFSQFTSMLELLAQDLDALGIDYLILTGQSRNRQQLVEAFQRGDAPVFLISLKAGGVGLNLTRADTVIHYDPWWNSAAEQQATDRAHRIGQDKPVFVYKLIAENTIEDKIAQLQQQKAQISLHINHQAQISGEQFALKLEDLMTLWQQETETT